MSRMVSVSCELIDHVVTLASLYLQQHLDWVGVPHNGLGRAEPGTQHRLGVGIARSRTATLNSYGPLFVLV